MTSLGLVETRSIAFGIGLTDAMVKHTDIHLIRAATICSGRFLILVSGDRAAVGEAIDVANETKEKLFACHLISRVSEQVMAALSHRTVAVEKGAIAILECRNVVSGIRAADVAVKAAAVSLVKLVCGQSINGKSYFLLAGEVADVEAGAEAAVQMLGKDLLEQMIIPSPDAVLLDTVIPGGGRGYGEQKSITRAP